MQLQAKNTRNTTRAKKYKCGARSRKAFLVRQLNAASNCKQEIQEIQVRCMQCSWKVFWSGSWMQPIPNICSSWSAELFTQLLDFISQLFIFWLLWETIRGLVAQYCPLIHLPFDSDDRFRGNFGIVQIQNGRQLFSAHYSALTSGHHWWDADNWSLW